MEAHELLQSLNIADRTKCSAKDDSIKSGHHTEHSALMSIQETLHVALPKNGLADTIIRNATLIATNIFWLRPLGCARSYQRHLRTKPALALIPPSEPSFPSASHRMAPIGTSVGVVWEA